MHTLLLVPARLAIAAAAALIAPGAAARDFCLLPDTAVVAPGTPFALLMHMAEKLPGDAVPWRTAHVAGFSITDARGRVDVDDPLVAGDPAAARLTLRAPGTAVIGLSTDPSYVELPADRFEAYLREEGHDDAAKSRAAAGRSAAPGRERSTRHAKTILNAGGPNSSVALSRLGLALEIVPETGLSGLKPGGSLPVRVFYRGEPDEQDRICVSGETPAPAGATYAWCGRLDAAGRASVPIGGAGWQMIRATRMVPLRDDPKADWQSWFATLTFRVDAGDAPAGGASR